MNFLGFRRNKNIVTGDNLSSNTDEKGNIVSATNGQSRGKTKNLLNRLHSCTSARDIRETLNDLKKALDLPDVLESQDYQRLLAIVHNFSEDDDLIISVLKIFSSMTTFLEKPGLPEGERNLRKKQFLSEIGEEAPLLLDILKNGTNEIQEHAVDVLQFLVSTDYSAVHKAFFSPQVCNMLVALACSKSSKVQYNCLQLVLQITATDTELQVLFGMEKTFESVFRYINDVGGSGGPREVADALNIVRNVLRDNDEVQQTFATSNVCRSLASFFESFISQLQNEWKSKGNKAVMENVLGTGDTSVNLITCLQIVNCFLINENNKESFLTKQSGLVRSGVFEAVASIALSGGAVDDAVRIAALRTLADLLKNCAETVNTFLGLDVISVVSGESRGIIIWPAIRGLLENLLSEHSDPSLLDATIQVFSSLLSVQECFEGVTLSIFKGVVSGRSSKKDFKDCGHIFLNALLGANTSSDSKYYTAHLLRMLIDCPVGAKKLLSICISKDIAINMSVPDAGGKKDFLFFDAFISYTISVLQRCSIATTTLSAYIGVLLLLVEHQEGAELFLSQQQRYMSLLQLATSEGSVHVKFWCGALAASLCVHSGKQHTEHLVEQFENHLGGSVFFDNIFFDVRASTKQWEQPSSSAFACGHSVLYDQKFVDMLKKSVNEYKPFSSSRKGFLPSTSGISSLPVGDSSSENTHSTVLPPSTSIINPQELEYLRAKVHQMENSTKELESSLQKKDFEVKCLMDQNHELQSLIMELQGAPLQNQTELLDATRLSEPTGRIEELTQTVHLLEQQLSAKDEERRQLLDTIRTMENQLRTIGRATEEVEVLKNQLQNLSKERDDLLIILGKFASDSGSFSPSVDASHGLLNSSTLSCARMDFQPSAYTTQTTLNGNRLTAWM